MIYIIGGTSRAGKSTVARSLAGKYGLSHIPFDVMMSALIKTGNPLSIDYKADSDVIAKQMWPFTKGFLEDLLSKETSDFILEGISFWPDLLNEISWENRIKACFIGYTQINTESKTQQLRANSGKPHSWQNKFSDEELKFHIENIKKIGIRLQDSCERNNFPYFESMISITPLSEEIEKYFFSSSTSNITAGDKCLEPIIDPMI